MIEFSNLKKINGNFELKISRDNTVINFPNLEEITGNFTIDIVTADTVTMNFQNLKNIGGRISFEINNTTDLILNFDSIETIDEDFLLSALTTNILYNFNSLKEIRNKLDVTILNSVKLTDSTSTTSLNHHNFSLDSLERVGTLIFNSQGCTNTKTLSFRSLTMANDIDISMKTMFVISAPIYIELKIYHLGFLSIMDYYHLSICQASNMDGDVLIFGRGYHMR